MSRVFVLLYGVIGYAVFFATFLYLIAFVMGLSAPFTVDAGGAESPVGLAIVVNAGLIALFGVQHSIMARPWFKRAIAKFVPPSIERTTFMLATCAVFALMFTAWRPIPAVLWSVSGGLGTALDVLAWAGWVLALASTFAIDHFDLFGLRQTWLAFRGVPYSQRPFQERTLYRFVRHPLMLGFLLAFWSAPTMTAGRLVFAAVYTCYVLVAIAIEERDLVRQHGAAYARYRERVPKLVPLPRSPARKAAAGVS
jgi:protein-S-isoprenylcysteine O-methyltransferase Ste14